MLLVAVTTAPRPGGVSYLAETLEALGGSPVVFDDVDRRGSRWNTWRALAAGGDHDRVLIVQDDIICSPGFLARAEAMAIPSDVGIINFHDCGDDFLWQPVPDGTHKFRAHREGGLGMIGAQCLLMSAEHARWLVVQDINACPQPGPHAVDFLIGWLTARSPRPNKLIVSPSPVRHVGERSACWDEARQRVGAGIPRPGRTVADLLEGR